MNHDRRPRVLHVLTALDFGGVEKHMQIIGAHAADCAMRHEFCAIGQGGASERALSGLGARVRCLGLQPRIPNWRAVVALYRQFRTLRPAVVHTHGAEANFHGLIAARLAGVPVRIGEEIGIPSHGPRARRVFRQVYRAAHRVIAISEAVRRWLVDNGEAPAHKAVRLYNPVLLAEAGSAPPAATPGAWRIGFVGRLEPVKNPLGLVQALKLLADAGVPAELVLVGDGSQRVQLQEYIAAHGLQQQVRLAGFQADPARWLRDCDVYVQPSVAEGFGLALVEAMGCGLPVIATRVGGAPEIIEHGRTGWLLNDGSPGDIAATLRQAFDLGRPALSAMGQAADAAVRGRFEPAGYLHELEQIYAQLLTRRDAS